MSIFLERFVLAVLATLMTGVVVFNTLKLDWQQRAALGLCFLALAYFVGHTVHKSRSVPIEQPASTGAETTPHAQQPVQAGSAQTNAPNSPAVTGNGNSFNYYSTSPQRPKDTAHRKSKQ
jgi:hypothetical protein